MYGVGFSLVACSKCGKPSSATNDLPYCGTCNQQYRKERDLERRQRAVNFSCVDDSCDQHHCGGCGVHYESWPGGGYNRCDECSM